MKRLVAPLMASMAGFILVFWSMSTSGPLSGYIDIPSIIITVGGSLCAVLMSFPVEDIKKVPKVVKELMGNPQENRAELVLIFSELSKKVRLKGVLSIEEDIDELDNDLLISGLQMVVDGRDGDSITELLELELDQKEEYYAIGPDVFTKWGEFAPAFGMIGTLIGLIAMLGELDDPSMIGSGMAVALLTTFYGSMLANLLFLPFAKNLARLSDEKSTTSEMIIEGVIGLQQGQNPRVIEQKLKSYLSKSELESMEMKSAESALNLGKQEG